MRGGLLLGKSDLVRAEDLPTTIATGTGVAPMRGYTQWLFPPESGPDAGPDRSNGKDIWLVYGTRYETDIYYQEEFEALACRADGPLAGHLKDLDEERWRWN